jgi:hypothetical protein
VAPNEGPESDLDEESGDEFDGLNEDDIHDILDDGSDSDGSSVVVN